MHRFQGSMVMEQEFGVREGERCEPSERRRGRREDERERGERGSEKAFSDIFGSFIVQITLSTLQLLPRPKSVG